MEILLVVTTLAVGVAVLYVTATLRTRTRQNTAPLIDGAVKDISGQLEATTGELKRQLQLMADELQRDRDDTRLEERKIQGRLDHADSRLSSLASQLMVELETIRRLGEQIGARQDQLSGDLRRLDHQVAQISEATMQFPPLAHAGQEAGTAETAAAEAGTAETAAEESAAARADGREGPAGVPGPARPADAALNSPSGPVAAGPGLG
jgi:TolA-binding protein